MMNHYQKLATFLLRLAGTGIAALGLLGLAYGGSLLARGTSFSAYDWQRFNAGFWYLLGGSLLGLLGRPIGRLLGRNLD
jgi:hypothetical protein